MSDITLEWFFQIPGLFITIGVLLILIALLVLIIGSSKAKKKQEDLALVDDEVEAVTNSVEPVNVLEPNSVNYLNGNSGLNPINNFNDNLLNDGVVNNNNNFGVSSPVVPNDNVNASIEISNNNTPIVNNTSNIVTPVNINDSGITPSIENISNVESLEKVSSDVNLSQVEPVVPSLAQPLGIENNVSNNSLNIQEPVIGPVVLSDDDMPMVSPSEPVPLVQNVNNEMKQESTIAPIFAEPIAPIDNVVEPVQGVQNNAVISEPLSSANPSVAMTVDNNASGVVPPIVEPAINNSNIVGTELIEPIEPVKQKDLVVDNVTMITPVTPVSNNTVNPTLTVENSEVEEIL